MVQPCTVYFHLFKNMLWADVIWFEGVRHWQPCHDFAEVKHLNSAAQILLPRPFNLSVQHWILQWRNQWYPPMTMDRISEQVQLHALSTIPCKGIICFRVGRANFNKVLKKEKLHQQILIILKKYLSSLDKRRSSQDACWEQPRTICGLKITRLPASIRTWTVLI